MTIHATLEKPKPITRRGQRHEDKDRLVQVMRIRKNMIGIVLKNKKSGEETKLGISDDGARALARCLWPVLRGNLKRWKEPVVLQWTATFIVTQKPKPSPAASNASQESK